MPFVVISPTQTDAKSPVDDLLMDTIREDLDYLLSAIGASNAQPFDFRVDGPLALLPFSPNSAARREFTNQQPFRLGTGTQIDFASPMVADRLDGTLIARTQTLTSSKIYLKHGAAGGSLVCDIRKYRTMNTPIQGFERKFNDAIPGGGASRRYSGLATQSVTRATPAINTQSIALWKAALNVQSIYAFTGPDLNYYRRIELDAFPDSDYKIGDKILLSGTTTEDGEYSIVDVNRDGTPNIIIAGELLGGLSASPQTTPAGTLDLLAWAFTYSNPVDAHFAVGEKVNMAGHTTGSNNFSGTSNLHPNIYAINQGGNNIILKERDGVAFNGAAQAAPAGTANCLRWTYAYLAATPATGFVVDKMVNFSGHTSGGNNGNKLIRAIDSGGFNLIVYSQTGVTQAAAAGSANSCFFVYPTTNDLSTSTSVGEYFLVNNTGLASLSGEAYQVTEINVLSGLNLVAYAHTTNHTGTSGFVTSTRVKVKFDTDLSATYSTASRICIKDSLHDLNTYLTVLKGTQSFDGYFDVVEINFGGGANYNAVVETKDFYQRLYIGGDFPNGRIISESRSVYSVKPRIDFPTISSITVPQQQIVEVTGTFNAEAALQDDDMVCLCVQELPVDATFRPSEGLVVQIG